ncbi:MAG: antitermination protein NusG [Planctomycetota bacterium]|nr:antitermination protein NusG [Planctomycetota bacterium]
MVLSAEGRAVPPAFEASRGLWHVLHTMSRQEKALARDLSALAIAYYLPLIREVKYYRGRKATVEVPLFAGYIFLRGTLEEAYAADRTGRVAGIIRVVDQEQLEWELVNLHQALSSGESLRRHPFLRKGARVEVKSGPLRGLQGVIEDCSGRNRLILQVEMLGRGISLEIEGSLLEAVG